MRIDGGSGALALPALPLSSPLVVQLVRDDPTQGWQASCASAKRSSAAAFRAVTRGNPVGERAIRCAGVRW